MKQLLAMLFIVILTGCETTPYQRSCVKLAPSVERIILGKWGVRVYNIRDLALFKRGTNEYVTAFVEIEHNIPNHWEATWNGRVLLRRSPEQSVWQNENGLLDIPDVRYLLDASEKDLTRFFTPATNAVSNQASDGE